jgi:hypothetical protein
MTRVITRGKYENNQNKSHVEKYVEMATRRPRMARDTTRD